MSNNFVWVFCIYIYISICIYILYLLYKTFARYYGLHTGINKLLRHFPFPERERYVQIDQWFETQTFLVALCNIPYQQWEPGRSYHYQVYRTIENYFLKEKDHLTIILEKFCSLDAFHVWILGKKDSEERFMCNRVFPVMNIPISSFLFPPALIKQRNLVSESLLQFTLLSSSLREFSSQYHYCGSSLILALPFVLMLGHVRDIFSVWDDYFTLTASYSTSLLPLRFRILSLLEQMNYSNFSSSKILHLEVRSDTKLQWDTDVKVEGVEEFCHFFSILLSQKNLPCVCSQTPIFLLSL